MQQLCGGAEGFNFKKSYSIVSGKGGKSVHIEGKVSRSVEQ